jgi:predicted transposase YbfD/YdcC
MDLSPPEFGERSRLRVLLEHPSVIEDGREAHRVAYPLAELLLLAVCGTIADCDDYDAIADWGEDHLEFLRRFLPFHHGVPTGRWLTIMMNRVNPALFSACFSDWVRACWPDRPELVAIDGKTLRRSHDRGLDQPALHLVSAFATTGGLVLGQEAVRDKSNELTAIPVLLERLAQDGGLKGAIVSIDAIACNGTIAQNIKDAGADYLLAVKANQPTLRREIEAFFKTADPAGLERFTEVDKGHGRIEQRDVTLAREIDWLGGDRRFPGELRLPGVAAIVKVESRTQLKDRCRFDTRCYITSTAASAEILANAIRGHWLIENQLHWTLDVVFAEDQSRLRKGHGARNMAVVRHFAINLVRHADEGLRPPRSGLRRKTNKPPAPKLTSIKQRRKIASWNCEYLAAVLQAKPR